MLDQTQRQAILTLHDRGLGKRAIARALSLSRNPVRDVLVHGGASPPLLERTEQLEPVREEILALFVRCEGNLVRVHEELTTCHGVTVSYPALTAFCRKCYRAPLMMGIKSLWAMDITMVTERQQ